MGNAIGIGIPMVSIALGGGSASSAPFIFDAITTADAEVFQMPLRLTSTINAEVDWGDGTSDTVTSSAEAVHTYATAGTHTITVTGAINGWSYYYANQDGVTVNKDQLGNVSQWGSFLVDEDVTFYQCSNMTVSATDRLKFTDTYSFGYWFFGTTSMTSIDVSNWDISDMTYLRRMFSTTGLTSIDISSWDTSNIESMEGLFNNSQSLATITGLENLDFTSLTDASGLLERCDAYVTGAFDFSWFTPPNVVATDSLFSNTGATSIDISGGWASSRMANMFLNCTQLVSINATNLDVSNVTNAFGTFQKCFVLTTITGHEDFRFTGMNGQMQRMFSECLELVNLDLSQWAVTGLTNTAFMFYYAKKLVTLDMSGWDMSSVTNMAYMFYSNTDTALTSLNISGWTTGPLTDMNGMFVYARNLASIDVSGWDTSNATSFNGIFYNCRNMTTIDVTNWNSDNVTDMEYLFYNMDGGSNPIVGLSGWNTGNVTNFRRTFQNCKFRDLDISGWDTSSATNMSEMLYDCDSFDENIGSWDINQVTGFASFMTNSTGLSTANYDALLIGWAAQIPLAYNGTLNFGSAQYTLGGAAEAARTQLIADVGAISDGGGV